MKKMIEVMDQAQDNVLDEIEKSQDPRIKRALSAYRKAVSDDDLVKKVLKQLVPGFMEFANLSDTDEKMMNEFIADTLREARHEVLEMSKQYVFCCEADGKGTAGAYRILSIPASDSWAALAYHILAAFGCRDSMEFCIEHDNDMYGPIEGYNEYGELIEDGHGVPLYMSGLRKNSKAVLSLSDMEDVTIECRIIRTIPAKTLKVHEAPALLDGKGDGPFSDSFDVEERKTSLDKRAADLLDQFVAQYDGWDEYDGLSDQEMSETPESEDKLKEKLEELRKKLEKEKGQSL